MRALTLTMACLWPAVSACSAEPTSTDMSVKAPVEARSTAAKEAAPSVDIKLMAQIEQQKHAASKAAHGYGEPRHTAGLNCNGVNSQGGMMICETAPFSRVKTGRSESKANAKGIVIIGLDRDALAMTTVVVETPAGQTGSHKIPVIARDYKVQKIDGLPADKVNKYTEADLKHIKSSSARKRVGFASNQEAIYFDRGFDYPLKNFTKTSAFGGQRILNGVPKSPHYGVDIAAPLGTPIYAPADGVVSLADEDLYFEGAMVVIDHGQGLNSLYLHVNDVFVSPGDVVTRGQKIAEVGSKGRSTGPHLCWRLKWRKENLDPELLTQWPVQN